MTVKELYIYVKDLVDKNSTGSNVDVTKWWFVDAYKINSIKYVNYLLNNRNDDLLRTIANLRVPEELEKVFVGEQYDEFSFPENYLNFINITATLTSDKCKKGVKTQVMKEVKPENIDLLFSDPYNEPSIKYAETLYNTSSSGVFIYKKGFKIKSAELYYYKKPVEIDIEGWQRDDGSDSINIDPDLSDSALIEVGIMMAKQFSMSNEDYNKAQALTQTQQIKK